MKRWIRLAARLYPLPWRRRYGDEFDALLEQTNGSWRELADVTGGAIMMNLARSRVPAYCALAGLIAGLAFWALQKPAHIAAVALAEGPAAVRERVIGVMTRQSLSGIISRHELYTAMRSRAPMEDVVEHMRRQVVVGPAGDSGSRLQFLYADRTTAQQVATELASALGGSSGATAVTESKAPAWPALALGLAAGLFAPLLLQVRARRVLGYGLAGAAIFYAASWLLPVRYLSTALLRGGLVDFAPLAATDMRPGAIHVEHRGGPLFVLAFEHEDPRKAQRAMESMLERTSAAQVLDPPSYPQLPVKPNRTVLSGIGFAVGVVLGIWRAGAYRLNRTAILNAS